MRKKKKRRRRRKNKADIRGLFLSIRCRIALVGYLCMLIVITAQKSLPETNIFSRGDSTHIYNVISYNSKHLYVRQYLYIYIYLSLIGS